MAERRARGRRGGDKRERILRGAVKVFAKKGFYASRVAEIARAAGVADGTIYLYFKNKDDVLTSLFEDRIARLLTLLRAEVERTEGAQQRVRRIVEFQLGLLEGERDLAEVITVNLRQSTRLLKQYATKRFLEYLDLMAHVVAEGQRASEIRDDVSPAHHGARDLRGDGRHRDDLGARQRRGGRAEARRDAARRRVDLRARAAAAGPAPDVAPAAGTALGHTLLGTNGRGEPCEHRRSRCARPWSLWVRRRTRKTKRRRPRRARACCGSIRTC
ncbi:MAG: TetR/AcrR family transcriptional regulator [Polyangiales bacterium]